MNWNNEFKILEERKDYVLHYQMCSIIGRNDGKIYFMITVSLHDKINTIYSEYKMYDSKSVPTAIKDIEKVLRKLSKVLIKRMKKDNVEK